MPRNRPYHVVTVAASLLLAVCATANAGEKDGFKVGDPHYGEVLFHFYQQQYFTALTDLVVSQEFDRLAHHAADAELLKGGLLLSWGQHQKAGEIFEQLLAEVEDQSIRNRTWFYLGKVRFQRGYLEQAAGAFESIIEPLPEELEAERYNLQAQVYMDQGRFVDAVELLSGWKGPEVWTVYARFNLGVALIRLGDLKNGSILLDQVGLMDARSEELMALRDRANLALGFAYLQADLEGDAKPVLQRVRLNGPSSNKSLLGVGWASSANDDYRKALAPWMELSERDLLDSAVQESLLAVPYAFAELGAQPQAAQYYVRALEVYDAEINRLDRAMQDADSGELVHKLLAQDSSKGGGWYWELDTLPDDAQTRYLYFAIADHRFHEGLKSYRDLRLLDEHLDDWRARLGAYRDILETRERAHEVRLPAMRARMAEFDVASMQRQYADLERRTVSGRKEHDVLAFATSEELSQWSRLEELQDNPAWSAPESAAQRDKQRVLKGLLQWDLEKEFRVRAWRQEQQLEALDAEIKTAARNYRGVNAVTASVPGSLMTLERQIESLEPRLSSVQADLHSGMQQHVAYLNGILRNEMQDQRQRLMTYRAQARFALASMYDRMSAESR